MPDAPLKRSNKKDKNMKLILFSIGAFFGFIVASAISDSEILPWVIGFACGIATEKIPVLFKHKTSDPNGQSNIRPQNAIATFGEEIKWTEAPNHVFRILEFNRLDTEMVNDKPVQKNPFKPYGYLLVESPILSQKARLPIIHRDDFWLAESVFEDPRRAASIEKIDFLVTYAPKVLLSNGFSGSPHPVLHYVIAPSGTLDAYYSVNNGLHKKSPSPQKLFGDFIYEGNAKVTRITEERLSKILDT